MRWKSRLLVAGCGVFVSIAAITPTFAENSGGVLRIFSSNSPASMSIHEESTRYAVTPVMAVFNNLVLFDQHIAKNSLDTIVPELAVHQNGRPLFDIALYSVPLPPRITLLVAPDHYFTLPHLKAFIAAFNKCAPNLARPPARSTPLFAAKRLVTGAPHIMALADAP